MTRLQPTHFAAVRQGGRCSKNLYPPRIPRGVCCINSAGQELKSGRGNQTALARSRSDRIAATLGRGNPARSRTRKRIGGNMKFAGGKLLRVTILEGRLTVSTMGEMQRLLCHGFAGDRVVRARE